MVEGAKSHERRGRQAFTLVEFWSSSRSLASWSRCCCRRFRRREKRLGEASARINVKQISLATLNFHDARKGMPPMRIVDGDRTWMGLILPYLEEAQVADLWDYKLGCFYDQTYKCRTAIITAYFCPSMAH